LSGSTQTLNIPPMDTLLAFALGALSLAAIVTPVFLWQRNRSNKIITAHTEAAADARLWLETLATSPDGLFVWVRASGAALCSRRLAVLLDLAPGTESKFADVAARFEGEAAGVLSKAVEQLQSDGTPFDLILPTSGSRQMINAVGTRAGDADGLPLADLLWMRPEVGTGMVQPPVLGLARTTVQTHDHLYRLLEHLPMPVWLRDADQDVVFANQSGIDQTVGEPARELAARAHAQKQALTERHFLILNESPQLLEITESPLEGWPGTVGFAVDHSAREAKEVELSRQAAEREQVLENLPTAIAIFDTDAKLVFFNTAYAALWQLEESWLSSEPGLGEILERLREDRRLLQTKDFAAFRDEQIGQFETLSEPVETLLHLPDGTTLRSVVSRDSLGGLVFSYENVTDRLALERSFNTVTAVQSATLENLHEAICVFGSDGRLKLSNPVFAEMWELGDCDLVDTLHVTDFVAAIRPISLGNIPWTDEQWTTHKENVVAKILSREPASGRLISGSGTILNYTNVPLPDGAVLLSYMDVTDAASIEETLRQRAETLQETNSLKSEFISNIFYEIRTPLNSIIGFADILCGEYFDKLTDRQLVYCQDIQSAGESLRTIMNDILDLAGTESGMMKLKLDTVDLHPMLESVLNLVRERAREKSVSIEFDCKSDIGWIVADETRLKQAVFTLLGNAVRFTPGLGTVRLSCNRGTIDLDITVSHTGTRTPNPEQDEVLKSLQLGYQSDDAIGESAHGLSLVARFIDLHGGHIKVEPAENEGATIVCQLPISSIAGN
jgi:signal transduction histidine kinase/PAS domain-containing protein